MKKNIVIIALVIIAQLSYGQGVVRKTREVSAFNGISLKGVGSVELLTGENKVEIEALPGDIKRVEVKVVDSVLVIYPKKDLSSPMKIYVSAPMYAKIKINGTGGIAGKDTLFANNLEITVGGTGNAELIVNCNNLKTKIKGTGDVKLSGKAIVHEAVISGTGSLMAFDLETEVTQAKISGLGDIHINAVEEVDVKVNGSGDVFLKNEPKKKNIDISGLGDVFQWEIDSTESDTTKLKFKNHKLWIITEEDLEKCDTCKVYDKNKFWAGFEIGTNGYLFNGSPSMPKGYEFLELNYAKSYSLNFNVLEKGVYLANEHIKITSGVGLGFNSYSFDNNITLLPNNPVITGRTDTLFRYKKNKLNTWQVNVPLLIGYSSNVNADKAFRISGGMVLGYRISTRFKQKYEVGTENFKNTIRANYNLAPFRYSARFSVGYGNFDVYATYSLSELFQQGEGPALNPFSVGVRVINF